MKKVYLLSTSHLEKMLWFLDDEDFRVAMNYVAIQAAKRREVAVLAFVLMSNHVHFVLRGTRKDVMAFVNEFKRCYSIYYQKKYCVCEFLRRNSLDIQEVDNVEEALEKVIAYVIDNPVAANICLHPSQYPWGTGNAYFNPQKFSNVRRIKDYSVRARIMMLHSECDNIPEEWVVDSNGYILPFNYVDVSIVEKLFKSPKRMNYFITQSSKAKKRFESSENVTAFRDQIIISCLPELFRSLFQKTGFKDLSTNEQSEFAKQLRFRFNSDPHQIARVCGISYVEAARLLEDYH